MSLLGLMLTANCVAEVPVFFYSGEIIKRLGVAATMQLSLAAYALRFLAYLVRCIQPCTHTATSQQQSMPWWPSLWLLLAVELLQGVSLGCSWSAGTVYCRRVAPPGLGATTQGLFAGYVPFAVLRCGSNSSTAGCIRAWAWARGRC